jgi:hypothetical protein
VRHLAPEIKWKSNDGKKGKELNQWEILGRGRRSNISAYLCGTEVLTPFSRRVGVEDKK